jgi:hypothetical protein
MVYAAPFVWNGGASNTGLTLTARILDSGGSVVTSGLSGVTEAGSTGIYRWYYAAFSDGLVGFVQFLNGSTVVAMFDLSPPAGLGSDWTSSRAAALDLLGSGQVLVAAPVAAGGDVTIVCGDDYLDDDDRALHWSSDDWPNLTGASVRLQIGGVGGQNVAGEVVTPPGTAEVLVELTRAQTHPLKKGRHEIAVEATLSNGSVVTLVQASMTVLRQAD